MNGDGRVCLCLEMEEPSMSVWVVAVAALAWLAVSAALTAGWGHMLLLWATGAVACYASFEAMRRIQAQLHARRTPGRDPASRALEPTSQPSAAAEPTTHDQRHAAGGPEVGGPEVGEGMGATGAGAARPRGRRSTGVDLPAILTAEEAASLLQVPQDELVAAIRAGEVPGNNIAGHWRCSAEALRAWLDGGWSARDS